MHTKLWLENHMEIDCSGVVTQMGEYVS